MINSITKTAIQLMAETFIRLPPFIATAIATTKPKRADKVLFVADKMAGNVITESVTYGT